MFPTVPQPPKRVSENSIADVTVTIKVDPWLNAFITDLGELIEKAVHHGLPKEIAIVQAENFIRGIAPYAVNVK